MGWVRRLAVRTITRDRGISGLILGIADNAGRVFLGLFPRSHCIRYNDSNKSDIDLLRNVTLETRSWSSLLIPSLSLLLVLSSSLGCVELSLRILCLSDGLPGPFDR